MALVWQPPSGYPSSIRAIQSAIHEEDNALAEGLLVSYLEEDSARLRECLDAALEAFPAINTKTEVTSDAIAAFVRQQAQ